MAYDVILFDLDGTMSDPLIGITRSMNYALESYGFAQLPEVELAQFIGLPIDATFSLLANTDSESLIGQLVAKYRERFAAIGYAENTLYPGVRETLDDLYNSNVVMGVCTSKRADYAEMILRMFEIDQYFAFVSGGDVGVHKAQQIETLLASGAISKAALMIGDRSVDLASAHANGIAAAGVTWGYGTRAELENESPAHIFDAPEELSMLKRLMIGRTGATERRSPGFGGIEK